MTTLPAIPETPQTASELLKHYSVIEMAKAFRERTAEIIRLMGATGEHVLGHDMEGTP